MLGSAGVEAVQNNCYGNGHRCGHEHGRASRVPRDPLGSRAIAVPEKDTRGRRGAKSGKPTTQTAALHRHVACSACEVRILWVKAGKILPVDTGGKIRSFNLLRHLANG